MDRKYLIWIQVLLGIVVYASNRQDPKTYLNRCLKINEFSQDSPKPEPTLECTHFRDSACCKPGVMKKYDDTKKLDSGLDYNQCSANNPTLSESCSDMMRQELCFFSCSPHSGPWLSNGTPNRYEDVPLCSSVCDKWWDSCKADFTCEANWYNLIESNGTCSSTCKTFEEVHKNAKTFCETIFLGSLKVTPDDQPCMKFTVTQGDPNAAVAEKKAKELAESSGVGLLIGSGYHMIFVVTVACFLVNNYM